MTIQQLQQYPLGEKGLRIQEQFRYEILYVNGISAPDTIEACKIEKRVELARLMDGNADSDSEDFFLPVLYPLSALTQEIEVYGEKFVPLRRIVQYDRNIGYKKGHLYEVVGLDIKKLEHFLDYPFWLIQLLQSWFINYQGIEAVSPFELKENPYK